MAAELGKEVQKQTGDEPWRNAATWGPIDVKPKAHPRTITSTTTYEDEIFRLTTKK
jgi:hypothetical protein